MASSLFFVLEFMDGGSFDRVRRIDATSLRSLAAQLLSGLQALHDARILHRDIKPANCLRRTGDGRIKVADLGIATELRTQAAPTEFAGTLPFMAPELLDHPPRYSPRSDLYAAGITLLEVALESSPWPTESVAAVIAWIRQTGRPDLRQLRPDLPPGLCSLVNRLCAPSVEHRPPSAAEAIRLLEDYTRASPGITVGASRASAWVLGEVVYESENWQVRSCFHVTTGIAARFSLLQPRGPLGRSSEFILKAAERASYIDHPAVASVLDWGQHEGRGLGETLYFLLSGKPSCEGIETTAALYVAKSQPPRSLLEVAPWVTAPTIKLTESLFAIDPVLRPTAHWVRDRARAIVQKLTGTSGHATAPPPNMVSGVRPV